MRAFPILMALGLFAAITPLAAQEPRWPTLNGRPPLVIAHRGASGVLPEHTLEAYQRAIRMGADFIEPDLVMTKDGHLIARHEPILDGTTDVARRPEFASRRTARLLDGDRITAFWASDFTLEEIKRLRAVQPNAARPKEFDGQFEIPTLEEICDLARREGFIRNRPVGIYPETKHPVFHFSLGLPMEDKLLEVLAKYDLTGPDSPVIIQSFETANLQYLRKKTRIRLVQLIDADDVAADGSLTYVAPYDKPYNFAVTGDPRGFADLVAPRGLADIAKYADGIGPWKRYIVSVRTLPDRTTQTITATNLIQRAHELGLFVHAYTFRNEPGTLAGSYNGNPRLEYMQFYLLGVDGVFSDFPDTAIEARRTTEPMIPR